MAQSKKTKKSSRGLKRGKNLQRVKTLVTMTKVVDASSPNLFVGCATGKHLPSASS